MLSCKTASRREYSLMSSAALNSVLCGLNYLAIVDLDCHRCDVASILVSLNDGAQVSNEQGVLVAYEKILILDQSSQLQKKMLHEDLDLQRVNQAKPQMIHYCNSLHFLLHLA